MAGINVELKSPKRVPFLYDALLKNSYATMASLASPELTTVKKCHAVKWAELNRYLHPPYWIKTLLGCPSIDKGQCPVCGTTVAINPMAHFYPVCWLFNFLIVNQCVRMARYTHAAKAQTDDSDSVTASTCHPHDRSTDSASTSSRKWPSTPVNVAPISDRAHPIRCNF